MIDISKLSNRYSVRILEESDVDYDAEAGGKVLLNENDVETVVLLRRKKWMDILK